ncbi:hypothetical protein [Dokdonella sp.]|uniref:hypothetical protein n=1 Tax=Dokdonella sp. TaxID=2291710 RepID=UPI0027BAE83A|nr:hypothetical protein [Dokdonella sp.]
MRAVPTILAALLAAPCLAASTEPPTQVRVTVDGKAYVGNTGTTIEVDVGGRKLPLRVEELPWRHFEAGRLRFDYPRHFPWEHDPEPPRSWTLDGNNAVLMVFENVAPRRSAEAQAEAIEELLLRGAAPRRAKAVLATAKAGPLSGVATTIKVVNYTMSNEIFVIDSGKSSWLLVLQDALTDAGEHTAEYLEMRARLSATLEF